MSTPHVVPQFAQMADDFFFGILLLKTFESGNSSLPFLHAHVLELSAKAACYKLGIPITGINNGHDILGIYKLLEPSIPNIASVIPTSAHLTDYKNIWFPSDAPLSNVALPPPEELHKLELAYYVDNVMNLKYGFTKQLVQVSCLQVSYKEINSIFLLLFTACREIYLDNDLNLRIKNKIFGVFGDTDETKKKITVSLYLKDAQLAQFIEGNPCPVHTILVHRSPRSWLGAAFRAATTGSGVSAPGCPLSPLRYHGP